VGAGECSGERGLDKWEDFMIISKLKLADDEWYNVEMLLLEIHIVIALIFVLRTNIFAHV
jgi:hypothetical protein